MVDFDQKVLVDNAIKAKENAYAPYSEFRVGAALLTNNNEIILGCNIENISLSPTVCAERSAVFTAIVKGIYNFKALAIASDDNLFSAPCGVCRQVLAEFVDAEFPIIQVNSNGDHKVSRFKEFFPNPFTPSRKIGRRSF